MTKELETQARSIRDKLRNLSKKNGLAFETLQSYFILERLVVRLVSDPELASRLVFKGGYVGIRVYESPRVTTDLDALLTRGNLRTIEKTVVKLAEIDAADGVWFRFQSSQDLLTLGEYGGLRILFRCGIGALPRQIERAQLINLDIGMGDPVFPDAKKETTRMFLGEGDVGWSVYAVETICSEKLHTVIVRGSANSRAKDIFDLNLLLPRCDLAALRLSMEKTFEYRGDVLPDDLALAVRTINTKLMKTGWRSAVAGVKGSDDFDEAFKKLIAILGKMFVS